MALLNGLLCFVLAGLWSKKDPSSFALRVVFLMAGIANLVIFFRKF